MLHVKTNVKLFTWYFIHTKKLNTYCSVYLIALKNLDFPKFENPDFKIRKSGFKNLKSENLFQYKVIRPRYLVLSETVIMLDIYCN